MKALPDLSALALADDTGPALPVLLRDLSTDLPPVGRMIKRTLAASLILAGLGIWAAPVAAPAVMLLRFGASLGLVGGGVALWCLSLRRAKRARVEIDTRRRELRVSEHDREGRLVLVRRYALAELQEATLCHGRFVARDDTGRLAVSAPVHGRAERAALRAALALV